MLSRSQNKAYFNPPVPCGAGLGNLAPDTIIIPFQSTRPLRGGTACRTWTCALSSNFNPPAPCGAGLGEWGSAVATGAFQSTRPLRGGTWTGGRGDEFPAFQSTRPLRGGTRISLAILPIWIFQSTRPLRGGTRAAFPPRHGVPYFNPPAPCGAGLLQGWTSRTSRAISIHPPLAGRDAGGMAAGAAAAISIHPPLAGRDAPGPPWQLPPSYFNPPAPCGAGLRRTKRDGRLCDFNPPAPCGAGPCCCSHIPRP